MNKHFLLKRLIQQQLIGVTLTGLFFVFVLSGIFYHKNAVGAYTEPSMDVNNLSYTCKRVQGGSEGQHVT